MEILGPRAQYWSGEPRAVWNGRWLRSYQYYRAATIFAGTSEVQRNIIAQRVLGLQRS
jgi:alkylation response protein AidB-like acyl-CoA dehydrogenase